MLPEIRKLLYCTQMGPNSSFVFRYACSIARRFSARIVVLHVMESLSPRQRALVEGYAGSDALQAALAKAEREAAEQIPLRIEETCRKELPEGEDWHGLVEKILVEQGRAADVILEQIERESIDLVVIGAHAESPVVDRIIGGTAREIYKRSPVPVLSVQVPEGRQSLTHSV